MTDDIRWGILATGGIAHAFAKDLKLHGHTLRAVGSRSQQAADAFAGEFGIRTAHGSYESLAADPDVDVIYIATPHPMHLEAATLALIGGKHVLIEKPIALNADQARQIYDLAAARGLVALEAMWTRFLPHMVRIREILASGTLGQLSALMVDHSQKLTDDPAHRINNLELGGGALLDLGIYPISFCSQVFGSPQSVQATAAFRPSGADVRVATTFGYPSGAVATTLSASDSAGPNIATILGTDGRMDIDSVWYAPTSFRVYNSAREVVDEYASAVTGRGMQFQADEMERLIRAGATSSDILPPAESIAIMETLDEVRTQIALAYPGE